MQRPRLADQRIERRAERRLGARLSSGIDR
jgi:hypothetical protein